MNITINLPSSIKEHISITDIHTQINFYEDEHEQNANYTLKFISNETKNFKNNLKKTMKRVKNGKNVSDATLEKYNLCREDFC
jgi:hypothetical protein